MPSFSSNKYSDKIQDNLFFSSSPSCISDVSVGLDSDLCKNKLMRSEC